VLTNSPNHTSEAGSPHLLSSAQQQIAPAWLWALALVPVLGRMGQSLARSRRDAAKCCDKCAELLQGLGGSSERSFGFRVSRTRISSP